MIERQCKTCKHYTQGVTDQQRHAWSGTEWGRWADGVCHLYFPRGYIGRKPPHPAHSVGCCFQWEEQDRQISLEEVTGP